MKRTYAVLIFIIIASFFIPKRHCNWRHSSILRWDISGYYLYLPALFIYDDLGQLKFYDKLDSTYELSKGVRHYAQYPQENTGKVLNKYAIGISLGELPMFMVADFYCKYINKHYARDGYSMPYQVSVAISNIIWLIVGMYFLARLLVSLFDDTTSALTLLCIGFGTNLYCYSYYLMGMSHILLFMLIAILLYNTYKWYQQPSYRHAIVIGLCLGWIIIARPVDIIIALLVVLWPLTLSNSNYKSRWQIFNKNKKHLIISIVCFALVTSIQLAYWKYITGHWVHFSYEEEGFYFLNPQILKGLFSYEKGWFIYTPIAFISFLGLVIAFFKNKHIAILISLYFIITIYLVFSWCNWWYGWGFGARAMIDSYAVLAICLAFLINYIRKYSRWLMYSSFAIFSFFVWLNLYQTEQFQMGAIQGENMNKEFYWRVWNKMHPSEEDWKYYNK